ncbi:SymE family type I addiction module toxin [Gilliamella apicola]|uniref:Toxin SymE-like domain-containing protein n=1 Tax=Gilliamella apicola TaxID=1196095 RepID=A0A2V4DX05_9GAMM|nr:hypothetical protein DKK79_10505 [Gilliamella apicola]
MEGYSLNGEQANPRPQLTIKGSRLEQLGFTTGQVVTITAKEAKLIIELAN